MFSSTSLTKNKSFFYDWFSFRIYWDYNLELEKYVQMDWDDFVVRVRLGESPEFKLFEDGGLFLVVHSKSDLIINEADVKVRDASQFMAVN